MYRLYDFQTSGNGYKVRLMLNLLNLPFQYTEVNILEGKSHTPEFLAINPNGRIPVLITPEGETLIESNAILCYLAENTPFMPQDRLERARVMQWLFYEQYSHEPFIATSRFWLFCSGTPEKFTDKVAEKREGGLKALALMDSHLAGKTYMAAETYTIADIALYAYTHVAHEGGFPLDDYPNIQKWLDRIAAHPRHIPITDTSGN